MWNVPIFFPPLHKSISTSTLEWFYTTEVPFSTQALNSFDDKCILSQVCLTFPLSTHHPISTSNSLDLGICIINGANFETVGVCFDPCPWGTWLGDHRRAEAQGPNPFPSRISIQFRSLGPPFEGEPIVDKPGKGAFYSTDLAQEMIHPIAFGWQGTEHNGE